MKILCKFFRWIMLKTHKNKNKFSSAYVKQFDLLINLSNWFSIKEVCLLERDNFSITCSLFIVLCNLIYFCILLLKFYLRSIQELMKIIVWGNFYFDHLLTRHLKGFQKNIARIILLLVELVIQGIWIIICKKSWRLISILLTHLCGSSLFRWFLLLVFLLNLKTKTVVAPKNT